MVVDNWIWYTSRAAGLVAYVLLWATVVWGTLSTSKPFERRFRGPVLIDTHRALSFAALSFVALHALVLLFDEWIDYGLVQVFVPFAAREDALVVGLGVVAFELGLVVAISFRLRRWIGQRAWRVLHFAAYPVWFLAFLHGLLAGTDADAPVVAAGFLASALAFVFALVFRVACAPPRTRSHLLRRPSRSPGTQPGIAGSTAAERDRAA